MAGRTRRGPTAIQLLQAVLLSLTLALAYIACRIRSSPASAAAVLILGFFILEPRAILRPHLVSFAGLAAWQVARRPRFEQYLSHVFTAQPNTMRPWRLLIAGAMLLTIAAGAATAQTVIVS